MSSTSRADVPELPCLAQQRFQRASVPCVQDVRPGSEDRPRHRADDCTPHPPRDGLELGEAEHSSNDSHGVPRTRFRGAADQRVERFALVMCIP